MVLKFRKKKYIVDSVHHSVKSRFNVLSMGKLENEVYNDNTEIATTKNCKVYVSISFVSARMFDENVI
jgi:hypothetical protein